MDDGDERSGSIPQQPGYSDSSVGTTLSRSADNAQIRYLRHNLDAALLTWQERGILPPQPLTQRGLDSLAKGTWLGEDQVTLLLRAALAQRQSVLTALKYQDDPERTAIVIAEAMTMASEPFPAEFVLGLRERDAKGDVWFGHLKDELRSIAASTDMRARRRAVDALWELQGYVRTAPADSRPWGGATVRNIAVAALLMLSVLLIAITAFVLNRNAGDSAVLPGGSYTLIDANGAHRTVGSEGFSIFVHEVTNREYRRCVAKGNCTPPSLEAAADIPDYYANSAFDVFPVVHVTAAQAELYCQARGMRLPSAEEWMLAAVAAPVSRISLIYPWGAEHDVQRANTVELQLHSPAAVGSFSPAGDSPIGVADLSGNVAEWTSTSLDGDAKRIVKGGSYRDAALLASAAAEQVQPSGKATDWIGFRCLQPGGIR